MGMRGAQAAVGGASQLTPLRRANMPAAVCPHSGITARRSKMERIIAVHPCMRRAEPVGQTIAFCGLSSLAQSRPFDRRQKAIVCPTSDRSEEHTSELQSLRHLVCRLLLEKNKELSRQSARCGPLAGAPAALARLRRGDSVEPCREVHHDGGVCGERSGVSALFFFNDTATTEIYTLSLHDAFPICKRIDDHRHQVPALELGRREVHRDGDVRWPAYCFGTGLPQHPFTQRHD